MKSKQVHQKKQPAIKSVLISRLIKQLISTAKSRGITQAQLAKSAELTAVGFSKAKTRGDIRASSLEKLAAQLDLELVLVPSQSKENVKEAIKAGSFFLGKASDEAIKDLDNG